MSNHFQPPAFPQPPVSHQLVRSATDRRIAGVAGGIGNYFGIDPIIVRLAFIGLVFTGIGALFYPIMWLVMPRESTAGPQFWNQGYQLPPQVQQVSQPAYSPQVQQVSQPAYSGVAPTAGARFDPMTGRPITTEPPRFDPYTGQPLPVAETAVSINNAPTAPTRLPAVVPERRKRVLAVALLAVAALVFSNVIGFVAALIIPLALMAGGVMLLRTS